MENYKFLNYLIEKFEFKSYLEIGVANGVSYNLVECDNKDGCDPYTDNSTFDFIPSEQTDFVSYRMTSDEMYERMPDDKKYDLIFVDGLHSELQSKKDLINSLKHINKNGLVVMHDALPRTKATAQEERIMDEWYGCVYKSIYDLNKIGGRYACVENSYAVVPFQEFSEAEISEYMKPSDFCFEDYEDDKQFKMHIITADHLFDKICIYHNSSNLLKKHLLTSSGKVAFGGTEEWVYTLANELSKRCLDITLFTDVFPDGKNCGVKYRNRGDFNGGDEYRYVITTTDPEIAEITNCETFIATPTCEFFNTNTTEFFFDKIAFLSEYQKKQFEKVYNLEFFGDDSWFMHTLPCRTWLYDDSETYEKENAMVWSSAPVRGLRFFIERVMPKIKQVFPDFKLYISTYTNDYYDKEWPKFINGVVPVVNSSREELAELQKKAKIWVYPNIGRSESTGFFYETFCITAVENALARNAIVCFDKKDGISTTLSGYTGFLDGDIINEKDKNFLLQYENAANALAMQAIKILANDDYRKELVNDSFNICKKYTWDNEIKIMLKQILE